MGAILKTNPVGIDVYIQQLQVKLFNTIVDANHWNLADVTKYEAYGRCFRNRTDDGYIAEVFTGGAETLGPELITNGGFAGNASGWNLNGWIYATNKIQRVSNGLAMQLGTPTVGHRYRITFDVSNSGGYVVVSIGAGQSVAVPAKGQTATVDLTAETLNGKLITFYPSGFDFINGTITNVSVKEIISGQAGNDYKEVYWNDTLTAISFFGISGVIKRTVKSEAQVHFVMFADLSKLALKDRDNNTIAHRADEELRKMVTEIIGRYSFGFTMLSVETGIENVLREYPGSRRDKRLKYVDMHPVHCFRINLNLIYDQNKNCQSLKLK